jgi:hypothetical protein
MNLYNNLPSKKVYGYVRVSTIDQADNGDSIEAQTLNIIQYCKNNNLHLIDTFIDAGISGSVHNIQPDIKPSENMNITTPEVSSNNENNNPQISIRGNIPFPPETMLICINEYNNLIKEKNDLIKENNDLKTQLANIQQKQLELLTTITSNTQTIDELKKENELLKEQITELKLENIQLKECNSDLISRNIKFNVAVPVVY